MQTDGSFEEPRRVARVETAVEVLASGSGQDALLVAEVVLNGAPADARPSRDLAARRPRVADFPGALDHGGDHLTRGVGWSQIP